MLSTTHGIRARVVGTETCAEDTEPAASVVFDNGAFSTLPRDSLIGALSAVHSRSCAFGTLSAVHSRNCAFGTVREPSQEALRGQQNSDFTNAGQVSWAPCQVSRQGLRGVTITVSGVLNVVKPDEERAMGREESVVWQQSQLHGYTGIRTGRTKVIGGQEAAGNRSYAAWSP